MRLEPLDLARIAHKLPSFEDSSKKPSGLFVLPVALPCSGEHLLGLKHLRQRQLNADRLAQRLLKVPLRCGLRHGRLAKLNEVGHHRVPNDLADGVLKCFRHLNGGAKPRLGLGVIASQELKPTHQHMESGVVPSGLPIVHQPGDLGECVVGPLQIMPLPL